MLLDFNKSTYLKAIFHVFFTVFLFGCVQGWVVFAVTWLNVLMSEVIFMNLSIMR